MSANFSSELTTSVLWLNKLDVDITCIRLKPYKKGDEIFIDVTQIIPLPEASNYEVKVKEQEREGKKVRTAREEIFRKYWAQLIERSKPLTPLIANRSTTSDHWLSAGIGRAGFSLNFTLTEDRTRIECYIRVGKEGDEKSKAVFKTLHEQRQQIEAAFGEPLDWQELPDRIGCRICKDLNGGWHTPESEWPSLQDRTLEMMMRLEKALKGPIQALKI